MSVNVTPLSGYRYIAGMRIVAIGHEGGKMIAHAVKDGTDDGRRYTLTSTPNKSRTITVTVRP